MKNIQAIILLFAANVLSGISQGILTITVAWYITNELNLPIAQSAVVLLSTLIAVIWGPYAGSLIDRYNRKKIFLLLNIAGFLLMGTLALLGQLKGGVTLFMAAPAFLMTIMVYNVHFPNLYAFAQEITLPKHYSKITSLIEIQGQISFFLAGAMASFLMEGSFFGVPIPKWSMEDIFLLDAFTYGLGILFIAGIRYQPIAKRTIDTTPVVNRILNGFRFLKEYPLLLQFGIMATFVFAAGLVSSYWVLPVYIERHLKASQDVFGLSEGLFALGALFIGVVLLSIKRRNKEIGGIIFFMAWAAVVFLVLGLTKHAVILMVGYGMIGLCNAGIRILRTTYIFRIIPNDIIGRTGSVFSILNSVMRMFFLLLFALPFFQEGSQVIYCMFIFSFYITGGLLFFVWRYKALTKLGQEGLEPQA